MRRATMLPEPSRNLSGWRLARGAVQPVEARPQTKKQAQLWGQVPGAEAGPEWIPATANRLGYDGIRVFDA